MHFARLQVPLRRCERTAVPFLGLVRWSQAERMLAQLGRGEDRPARKRQIGRLLQGAGDLFVGLLGREREMAPALDGSSTIVARRPWVRRRSSGDALWYSAEASNGWVNRTAFRLRSSTCAATAGSRARV